MPKPTLFVVTDELQRALDELPPDQQRRSRLEPLKPFILRWRRQGRTYRRIAELLTTECNLPISHIAVRKFVKRCARPRKPELGPQPETEQAVTVAALAQQPTDATITPRSSTKILPEAAAQPSRPSLQSFRNKPALPPKPPVLKEFHYDESKPLTIDRTIKD